MTKLQEIRSEIWLNRYYKLDRETHDHDFSVKEADRIIKDFDSRFPMAKAGEPVMLNGGKWISILEAELALESASEIILKARDASACGQLREPAIQWLRRYYPTEDQPL